METKKRRSPYAVECCRCTSVATVHVREHYDYGGEELRHYCKRHGEGSLLMPVRRWFYGDKVDRSMRVEEVTTKEWRTIATAAALSGGVHADS